MDLTMRLKILADTAGVKSGFAETKNVGTETARAIGEGFNRAGEILKRSIGWAGLAVGLEQAIDGASQLQSLQSGQATILMNQGVAQQFNVNMSKQQYEIAMKSKDASQKMADLQSNMLVNQATMMSLNVGISQQSITQAQTMLLTNQDMVKLFTTGKKVNENGVTMNKNLNDALYASANLAHAMGGGQGGSIASSSRMLSRMLADPAKHMASMTRYGFTLSKSEQARIKSVQATNGLLASQALLIRDINNHLKDVAKNSVSPVERLKNDIKVLENTLGQALLPILDSLATALGTVLVAFQPVLKAVGGLIKEAASQLGDFLGRIMADFKPILTFFVQGIFPMIINLLVPAFKILFAVIDPVMKALNRAMPEILKIINLMSKSIDSSLTEAFKAISKAMNEMVANGTFKSMMTALVSAFQMLAQISPAVFKAFSQLLIALAPLIQSSMPAIILAFQMFATILTDVGVPVLTAVTGLIKGLAPLIKALAPLLGPLIAIWFTNKVFVQPMEKVIKGIKDLTKSQLLFNTATEMNPWVIVAMAIVGAIILIATHWKTVSGFLISSWTTIKSTATTAWDFIYNHIAGGINRLTQLWNGFMNYSGLSAITRFVGIGDLNIGKIKPIGTNAKPTRKMHSGGIVPGMRGREVPAILQAGEAVVSLSQMNASRSGGGSTLNVHPNAVNITVNGNADHATVLDIQRHVEAQFKEFHKTLRGMGR
jgi:phage-related protein